MTAPTRPARPDPADRRTVIVVVVLTQVLVSLVTATGVYVAWRHLDANLQAGGEIQHSTRKQVSATDEQAGAAPLNILVLGTDTRAGAGDAIDKEKGCNCSDTTILVHVSADRTSAYGISIPRDALVKPVACTRHDEYLTTGLVEWNAAYASGGPQCTATQLEKAFHIYVDGYVVMDFGGFKNMVNAVGGVDVCIPFELADPKIKADFKPGRSVHLGGTDALTYVRLRHVLDGSDIGRIKRQQVFVSALVRKLVSAGTLTRPDRLYRFADALTSSITTNPELAHVDALVRLAEQFRHIDLSHIRFLTLPNRNYPDPPGTPLYGRVEILPAAYRLARLVSRDEPLGAFSRASVSPGHGHRHVGQAGRDQAAASGVCT